MQGRVEKLPKHKEMYPCENFTPAWTDSVAA